MTACLCLYPSDLSQNWSFQNSYINLIFFCEILKDSKCTLLVYFRLLLKLLFKFANITRNNLPKLQHFSSFPSFLFQQKTKTLQMLRGDRGKLHYTTHLNWQWLHQNKKNNIRKKKIKMWWGLWADYISPHPIISRYPQEPGIGFSLSPPAPWLGP